MRKPNKNKLVLIGGAEDRKDKMLVLKSMVRGTGAKNILVVSAASGYPREAFKGYQNAFLKLGVPKVNWLDVIYRDEVDRTQNFDLLREADLVFFGGGDQVRLVKLFDSSYLLAEMKERFLHGRLSIAGTSAGAAAASDPMLYDGDYKGFEKGGVKTAGGFGFIDGVTVDTHFLNRERIPRLCQFLLKENIMKGIGLDEDTGIIISPDLKFKVIGSGSVTVINTDKVSYSNYSISEDQKSVSVNNLRMGFLSHGTTFSIKRWSVLKSSDTNNLQSTSKPSSKYHW